MTKIERKIRTYAFNNEVSLDEAAMAVITEESHKSVYGAYDRLFTDTDGPEKDLGKER